MTQAAPIAHPTPLDAQVTPHTMQALRLFNGRVVMTRQEARAKARAFERRYVIRPKQ